MPLFLSVSSQSPHCHSDQSPYSLKSTPILLHTHAGLHPVHFVLYFHFECRMLLGGLCARPFPPYFAQYLHPVGFFFFSLLSSRPLFLQLWALRDVGFFSSRGGVGVILKWVRRGSGDCVVFLFIFVYAIPFSVLGPRCPWLWRLFCSPRHCPTGIVVTMADVAPTAGAWSSPD